MRNQLIAQFAILLTMGSLSSAYAADDFSHGDSESPVQNTNNNEKEMTPFEKFMLTDIDEREATLRKKREALGAFEEKVKSTRNWESGKQVLRGIEATGGALLAVYFSSKGGLKEGGAFGYGLIGSGAGMTADGIWGIKVAQQKKNLYLKASEDLKKELEQEEKDLAVLKANFRKLGPVSKGHIEASVKERIAKAESARIQLEKLESELNAASSTATKKGYVTIAGRTIAAAGAAVSAYSFYKGSWAALVGILVAPPSAVVWGASETFSQISKAELDILKEKVSAAKLSAEQETESLNGLVIHL